MNRTLYTDEHLMFRDAFRRFVEKEIVPHHEQWEHDGIVPRDVWQKAGSLGFLCFEAPEDLGGMGVEDYRYHAILAEALSFAGASGIGWSSAARCAASAFFQCEYWVKPVPSFPPSAT